MNLLHLLQSRLRTALTGMVADTGAYESLIKPAQDAKFGDYQANCAMPLGKVLSKKPREVAEEITARLPLDDALEKPEIAGPGFINLRFQANWLAEQLKKLGADERLGVEPVEPKTYVIDFSSPNVAKPMHVGHLRSTIIGDSLTRILRFLGHTVITDNHLGDWGTQFGMLLYGYKHFREEAALAADPVREMVRLYVAVRKLTKAAAADDDEETDQPKYTPEEVAAAKEVAEACRRETARLQAGDPENLALWQKFQPWCLGAMEPVYDRLGVQFDHTLGESFYNPMLADVVADLRTKGIVQESQGAIVAFLFPQPPPKDKNAKPKDPVPDAIVRKSDGAATYTTTDLATIQYRVKTWNPDEILYVVDSRQAGHFKAIFELVRRWGYDKVCPRHISFGSVLDPKTKKPLKTRDGKLVELSELLDESVREATRRYRASLDKWRAEGKDVPDLPPDEFQQVVENVGLGAVKFADLSQNRETDYDFDWDKMLAMTGNTATYVQYAYARCRAIFREGDEDAGRFRSAPPPVQLEQPHERALGLQLLRFPEAVEAAAADYRPHLIAAYLWDLAKAYSGFFQNCPVLKAETPVLRDSRLLLCDLTARIIQKGLDLLGIRTNERM
jgi:arginyl-tRNA synthetase